MAPTAEIFSYVPDRDYMGLLEGGHPKSKAVLSFFEFEKKDIASATSVPVASVRYDERMPEPVRQRMTEWVTLVNLVAQFFQGDAQKTELWFRLPNPILGNVSPRDMIRFGRYESLRDFIYTSLAENKA
ncbi:MAG TPA: hypothetical protein VNK24_04205 [Elusimicrobiota bacterium]|nr:hypothetical protein [Elusimicrobiota bacterium]